MPNHLIPRSLAILFVLSSVAEFSTQAQAAVPTTLEGTWFAQTTFGPPVRGELTIDGRAEPWLASVSGYSVPVRRQDHSIAFTLPGQQGEFRADMVAGTTINGFWTQSPVRIFNQPYITPIRLRQIESSVWRGTVLPLEERFSYSLTIARGEDGKFKASLVNPEMNMLRNRIFQVSQDGVHVHLETGKQSIDGEIDPGTGTLTLRVASWLPAFEFHSVQAHVQPTYQYRTPVSVDDGWRAGSLADAGLDEKPLAALIEKIRDADPADNPVNIQSILVARHDRLVLEEYFHGFSEDRPHDMRSASKTFATVLAGATRQHPAAPIYPLFQGSAPANRRITLRDLMTMTPGLACDDNDDASPGNEDNMQGQTKQPDWYKYALDLPMAHDPGGVNAIYCSASLNLVGGFVAKATRRPIPELFDETIARPLQFGPYYLNLMPTGEAYMGGGAYLRPRDQLKIGQLYLNRGMWKGKRIVDADWVEASTTFHSHFANPYLEDEHQYGYGWHLHHLVSGGKSYRAFAAEGNGGQFLIVLPELDMVVSINGGSYGEFKKWYRWELELVPQHVIPAVKR